MLDKGALVLPGVFEQAEIGFDTFSTQLAWRIRAAPQAGAPPALELSLTDTHFANADAQGELSLVRWQTGAGGAGQSAGAAAAAMAAVRACRAGSNWRAACRAAVPPPWRAICRWACTKRHAAMCSTLWSTAAWPAPRFKVKGDLWDFPFAAAAAGPAATPPAASSASLRVPKT